MGPWVQEDIYIVEIHELPPLHSHMLESKSCSNAISAYYFGCKATEKFKMYYNHLSVL